MKPSSIYLSSMYWIVPVQLIMGTFLFFRGHNAPGGGFIAGLVFASGIYLWYSRSGILRLPGRFSLFTMSFGLLTALISGLPGLVQRQAFMAAIGKSIMLFDFGVMLVVIGITLFILECFQGEVRT